MGSGKLVYNLNILIIRVLFIDFQPNKMGSLYERFDEE
jgi:hypothetical protein